MRPRLPDPEEYGLARHSSRESVGSFELDDAGFELYGVTSEAYRPTSTSLVGQIISALPFIGRRYRALHHRHSCYNDSNYNSYYHYYFYYYPWQRAPRGFRRKQSCRYRNPFRLLWHFVGYTSISVLTLVLITALFFPSYTRPPPHYRALSRAISSSHDLGRGNPRNEKVFIASSIYDKDGSLAGGKWAENILELVGLLGPSNVYLSIYENDTGDRSATALKSLEAKAPCNKSLVYEPHLDLRDIQNITLPDGSSRVKRIAYLAEVRNRALRPLDEIRDVRFDKLLYLNDIYFNPADAVQLLFSTNVDPHGVAQYRAACAVDFINLFKFYDTFAGRDLEGYGMGLPLYPWFSTAGTGQSRRDVQNQRDAVRVRSCWGGMVAFDARFFQHWPPSPSSHSASRPRERPVRFRAETDLFWDASECCLIHADIQIPPCESQVEPATTGIYMNPFIRVAYDPSTLSWLGLTRRVERLFSIPQNIINHMVNLPKYNPRRTEKAGQYVQDDVWVPDGSGGGSYESVVRKADTGGFCGRRGVQVMVSDPAPGQKYWEKIPIPTPPEEFN
ncbi:hypothetical protein VTO42DRAFT_2698 [Malbranchea cinnamomea]